MDAGRRKFRSAVGYQDEPRARRRGSTAPKAGRYHVANLHHLLRPIARPEISPASAATTSVKAPRRNGLGAVNRLGRNGITKFGCSLILAISAKVIPRRPPSPLRLTTSMLECSALPALKPSRKRT